MCQGSNLGKKITCGWRMCPYEFTCADKYLTCTHLHQYSTIIGHNHDNCIHTFKKLYLQLSTKSRILRLPKSLHIHVQSPELLQNVFVRNETFLMTRFIIFSTCDMRKFSPRIACVDLIFTCVAQAFKSEFRTLLREWPACCFTDKMSVGNVSQPL